VIIFQELAAQRTCHPTKRLYENVLFELHIGNFLWVQKLESGIHGRVLAFVE
jgi:hypothetical protein